MKRSGYFIAFLLLLPILYINTFLNVAAAEAAELPITIKSIFPDNQKAGITGYFDLQVSSGEKQTIFIQITNNKSEDIVVEIIPTNAYTSPTGTIFYKEAADSPETILLDEFFALSKCLSLNKEVAIKAKETVKVPIEVTAPNIDSGTMLGGILISEKEKVDENVNEEIEKIEKDTAKFRVLTKTAFALAIQLDFPNQANPAFSFGKAGFKPNGAKVFIEMVNDATLIQRDISGVYEVTNKDGEKLFAGEIAPMIMAPKTQINYPFPWGNPTLEPGNYTLSINANVAGEEIAIERVFKIDNNSVKKYAESANQPIAQTQTGIPYWAAILAVVILGGLMFWFGKRKA